GIASMFIQGGLNLGVDFRGGRYYIVKFNEPVVASDIRSLLMDDFKNQGIEVKTFGSNNQVKVTTSYLVTDESSNADNVVANALNTGLKEYGKPFEVIGSSKVGATVADDIIYSSYVSLVLALIGILLYVSVRFRKWQFGLGGVVALFHDALVVVSLYSIAGLFGISFEVDQVFIAAILTIIGYSINDTVVVFDRVREFTAENPKMEPALVYNKSILDTFSRTIMTAFTVFVVVTTLLIFGGEVLRGFSFAMLIGVIFGSYSSIFIAVPIVLDFSRKSTGAEIALEKSKV
ncbi:MAG: protein translocase subunit SecF, partial [Cytophagales bacterium]|nr:protein translocase subunit SecF [Cytophagales bacterium]